MDNNPIPTNQPNGAGNETPENIVPSPTPENTTPNPAPESTPENTPQPSQAAPISTETAETAETAMPAETPTTNETPTTPEAPVAPATTEAPATPEPSPTTAPATPAAHVAHTMNPTPATTPTSSAETPKKQGGLPVGLIIGLAIGGVILFGGIVTAVVLLLFGGKVDYEATYKSFDALETSMDSIDYGDCYKVHNRIDSSYTSSSEYGEYITGCVAEFTALESATNEFAKTSGAKHDEDIKNAFESFKSALESIYTKKSDLESQLSIYTPITSSTSPSTAPAPTSKSSNPPSFPLPRSSKIPRIPLSPNSLKASANAVSPMSAPLMITATVLALPIPMSTTKWKSSPTISKTTPPKSTTSPASISPK